MSSFSKKARVQPETVRRTSLRLKAAQANTAAKSKDLVTSSSGVVNKSKPDVAGPSKPVRARRQVSSATQVNFIPHSDRIDLVEKKEKEASYWRNKYETAQRSLDNAKVDNASMRGTIHYMATETGPYHRVVALRTSLRANENHFRYPTPWVRYLRHPERMSAAGWRYTPIRRRNLDLEETQGRLYFRPYYDFRRPPVEDDSISLN